VERRHRSPALRGERPSGSATSRSFFRDDRTDNGLTGGHGMVNCSPSWGVLKIRLAQWALVEVVIPARGGTVARNDFWSFPEWRCGEACWVGLALVAS
jgi:hypothetical protein